MKLKSVAGLVCYVKDLKKTAQFYKALGFVVRKEKAYLLSVRLNWFFIDFIPSTLEKKEEFIKEAKAPQKGAGLYLYLSVDDVDGFYQDLLEKRVKPSSEPRDWPWGNREFVIRDPDGYKLVIFKKKK